MATHHHNLSTVSRLEHAISCYPILTALASYISTVDLFNLALTNQSNHSFILGSSPVRFEVLRRNCLCDGCGLRNRQASTIHRSAYNWGDSTKIHEDEEIEVRVFNVKCDEAGALPCRKCGINICEECRVYPRVPSSRPESRPHLNSSWSKGNVMVMCPTCDEATERDLKGKFLNELCDCDVFKRWICHPCVRKEGKEAGDYHYKHTLFGDGEGGVYDSDDEVGGRRGYLASDHQHDQWFFCPCGGDVPREPEPRFRCCWCKRKHLPEGEWDREWEEVGKKMPWLDNDPTYPFWVTAQQSGAYAYPIPYPPLRYSELVRGQGTTAEEQE